MIRAAAKRDTSRIERLQRLFMRICALIFIALSLQIWMRATGTLGDEAVRFDTMPDHWRLATAILCVLLPVAALGLWGGEAWGGVLWIAAAIVTILMHGVFPAMFGRSDLLLAFHVSGLLTLAAFRSAILFVANKR